VRSSAERIVNRPPRPLVRANAMQGSGVPLGHKPMSQSKADEAMKELVGLIANGNGPTPQLDPKMAEIVAKLLGKHARHS
jgi:hypothetical protein